MIEIKPDIYQLQIPIHNNPLGHTNTYLIRDKDGYLLIDAGWDSEEALDNYRSSPFFAETWRATKALFAAKAEAWSVHLIDEPDLAKF